jgi:hypothetical protein
MTRSLRYVAGLKTEEGIMASRIEGGCQCGAVRYRATGAALASTLCHCRTCRRVSGAPSVAWVVLHSGDFLFTGEKPVSFNSSPGVQRTFCGKCGSPLTYQRTSGIDTIDVTTATLDAPDDFPPTKEIWTGHKLAWERLNEALQQFPRSSVSESSHP